MTTEQKTLAYLVTHHAQLEITKLLNAADGGSLWNGAYGWERLNHGDRVFEIKFQVPNTDPTEVYTVRAERDRGNFELTSDIDLGLPVEDMKDVLRDKSPSGIWWRPLGSNGARLMSRTLYPVSPDVQIRDMIRFAYQLKHEQQRRIMARLVAEQPAAQG